MKIYLLINMKMPFAISFLLNIAELEIFSANKYENAICNFLLLNIAEHEIFSANKYENAICNFFFAKHS